MGEPAIASLTKACRACGKKNRVSLEGVEAAAKRLGVGLGDLRAICGACGKPLGLETEV